MSNWQPVQLLQCWTDMIAWWQTKCDPSCGVLHSLENSVAVDCYSSAVVVRWKIWNKQMCVWRQVVQLICICIAWFQLRHVAPVHTLPDQQDQSRALHVCSWKKSCLFLQQVSVSHWCCSLLSEWLQTLTVICAVLTEAMVTSIYRWAK